MIRHNGIEIDTKARTIAHMGETRQFDKTICFEKICYFIFGGGVSLEMAFNQFYGNDPEGGPLAGPRQFNIFLHQWQDRFLSTLQLEWRSYVIAGVTFYEIVSKHQVMPPQRFAFARGRGGQPIPWVRPKNGKQHAAH